MKQFDNIVSALLLSSAACFAAVGCAATSGDVAVEDDTQPVAEVCGGLLGQSASIQSQVESPNKGDFSKKQPSTGQAGGAPSDYAPAESANKGDFSKKMPSQSGAAPVDYAPVTQGTVQSSGDFSKKLPSNGQSGLTQ